MPLFSIKGDRLERVKEVPFKSERKDIQHTTESSLKEVFGFEFVKSELELGTLRIDTLAFDDENKSFIIIEYKIDQSFSVIDQGYAYLALLLNNKAEFILEYNECKSQGCSVQSAVLFVFTRTACVISLEESRFNVGSAETADFAFQKKVVRNPYKKLQNSH